MSAGPGPGLVPCRSSSRDAELALWGVGPHRQGIDNMRGEAHRNHEGAGQVGEPVNTLWQRAPRLQGAISRGACRKGMGNAGQCGVDWSGGCLCREKGQGRDICRDEGRGGTCAGAEVSRIMV